MQPNRSLSTPWWSPRSLTSGSIPNPITVERYAADFLSDTEGGVKRPMEILGYADGTLVLAALVLVLYALVIWMLLEIMFRADFSG